MSLYQYETKWGIPVAFGVAVLVVVVAVNLGTWYSESKNKEVEILVPNPSVPPDVVAPPVTNPVMPIVEKDPVTPSLTPREIAAMPWDDQPLEARYYERYAEILEDPTGFKRGVDYTPVVPYIKNAMKKGYLTNADWKGINVEMNKAEAIPQKARIVESMRRAKEKMREALE